MSVIIRLQNLPWSANALDIRQFFRGLSIPEGGVHIVGGEMGDAFIAFSTDEDARQAMMFDREAINGVQIRLLLSSRAEMQKVIETARQQSLLALKKAAANAGQPKVSTPMAVNAQKPIAAPTPQPPIITANSFKSIIGHNATVGATPAFLAYQQQAGFTLFPESNITNSMGTITASSTKNSNDSDGSESRQSREKRRSNSRERRRSRSRSRERSVLRRRREQSKDKSREHDRSNNKRSSRHRSRSRERSRARSRERSRERSHEHSRTNNRDNNRQNSRDDNKSRNMDTDNKSNSNVTVWSSANAYKANFNTAETGSNFFNRSSTYEGNKSTIPDTNKSEKSSKSVDTVSSSVLGVSVTSVSTTFQNYNTTNQIQTAVNNYSLSGFLSAGNSNDSLKAFALQNPYTTALNAKPQDASSNTTSSSAIPGIFVEKKSDDNNLQTSALDATNSLPQEPIAFANVNPYEQMYPNLFAQAAAINSGQKLAGIKQSSMTSPANSPRAEDNTKPKDVDPNDTSCIKISNMCSRTTYSDLRKFFGGLFIPHNGIKMLNDKHGLRIGIAYVQFSRQSSVAKALCRSNNVFKGKSVIIEPVPEQEFNDAEDSFRPSNQDKAYSHRSNDSDNENSDSGTYSSGNNNYGGPNPYKKMINLEPFTVLYIEDIPALATEQDIMKMFSSYSLYDILLIASPENRREFVAHVRFSREEDAKSAYEDRAHHQIGYRRVRVRPGSIEEMENAKEKIRLANEQLMKEEQAAEEEETKRKLEKLITERITLEEDKKHHQQKIISMDLTQEDADEDGESDVIETTDELKNSSKNRYNKNYDLENYRNSDTRNNKFNMNVDPRRPQTPQLNNNIPSLFDFDPLNNGNMPRNQNRPNLFNDPRLRNMSEREAAAVRNMDNCNTNQGMANNNFNNFATNFNNQSPTSPPINNMMNNTENNFVILKNCDYGTRINDVAQLLLTANLGLKHIEPLHNERQLPTGEFIVEFRRQNDAEIAIQRFHNIQFRNRSLRVFPITPQEIADRLGKPFLNYIPGGNGVRMNKGMSGDSNMQRNNNPMNNNNNNNNNNNRFNNIASQNMNCNNFRGNNPFSDNNGPMNNNGRNNNGGGIPEKFTRPGCVLSLENVPYKAQLSDILRFFQGFDLTPDDIIRRYNDDGTPTGDARVAFVSPDEARAAYDAKKRKHIFGRNVYISIV
ncbi:hypothetical protein DOY81_002110 [Sarcophaga bullata]|nr:hypothetical protein DOY81_002110 [Sarcophaga bullata]